MTIRFNTISQLETINNLIVKSFGLGTDLSENIKKALSFYKKQQPNNLEINNIKEKVNNLLNLYFGLPEQRLIGVQCLHLSLDDDFGSLWVCAKLKNKIMQLSGYKNGFLLITGLRQMIMRNHLYWTSKRNLEFKEINGWIESYVADRISTDQSLKIIII